MHARIGILFLLLSAVPAFALENGREVDDSYQPAVRRLDITGGYCTGTFIGPHTMVTAAHCIMQAGATAPAGRGADLSLTVGGIHPVAYRTPPQFFSHSAGRTAYDVAVVEFADNQTFPSVDVAERAPNLEDRVELVGYGETRRGDFGTAGTRRAGSNVVFDIALGEIAVKWALGDEQRRAIPMGGDSGGPLFNGNGELVGITEGTSKAPVDYLGERTDMGTYIDVNEPIVRGFLMSAVRDIGGSALSLYRTAPAKGLSPADGMAYILGGQQSAH